MVTRAEYHAALAKTMPEAELQRQVIQAATGLGYRVWHNTIAWKSDPGWPDLCLVGGPHRRVLYRELKATRGKVSAAQESWLASLAAAGQDVGVWRPLDWLDGTITKELTGP